MGHDRGMTRISFSHVKNRNVHEFREYLLQTKSTPIAWLNLPIIQLPLIIRHWKKAAYYESNPVKSSRFNSRDCHWKGLFSDSDWTARLIEMAVHKNFEMISEVNCNRLKPKFAAKTVANKERCLRALYELRLSIQPKIFWKICLRKSSFTVLLTNHQQLDMF